MCVCEGETEVLHDLATNNSPNCTLLRSPSVTSRCIKCITNNLAYALIELDQLESNRIRCLLCVIVLCCIVLTSNTKNCFFFI